MVKILAEFKKSIGIKMKPKTPTLHKSELFIVNNLKVVTKNLQNFDKNRRKRISMCTL